MKKMLIFQPTIGSYRVDLYNYLSTRFDVKIYLEYFQSDFEIYDSSESSRILSIKPHLLNKLIKLGNRQLYKGYWHAIKSTNPDVILVSEFGVDAVASILYKWIFRKKYKIISLCDDSYHMLSSNWDFSMFHKITRKLLVPTLDDIIVVEPEARDWYKKLNAKGYYFPIISNEDRIRKNYEKALPKSREYIRKYELGDKVVFIYVGRLVELKNVNLLIDAFSQLNTYNAKLIIIGDGEQSEILKAKARYNENIIFTGRLTGDSLYAWFNIANALILPSVIEPFGAVTNEALIAGCKVIVSNNAGSRCLIEEGFNGYIIDPNSREDIIHKIKNIISKEKRNSNRDSLNLRKSLMNIDFKDAVEQLGNHINNL